MKQTWIMLLLVILTALPVTAASIAVKAPVAGESIEIGTTKPIAWTFSGLPNTTKVKLVLWQSGTSLGIIAQNLAIGSNGKGSYDWNAGTYTGGPAKAGAGYRIRVRTMDDAVSEFGGIFTLSAKPADPGNPPPLITLPVKFFPATGHPCMAVTSPKAGDSADPFNFFNIKWTKNGTLDPNVSITLKHTGKGAMFPGVTLAASVPNNGFFPWNLATQMPAPGVYTVRVRTLDGKCEAASDEFTINEVGSITLLSPKGGEVWENGTAHAVTWKRTGNIQTVDLLLNRANSKYMTLAQAVDAKLGTKTCVFERAAWDQGAPCHYELIVKQSGSGTTTGNLSACFQITGNPDLAITNVGFSGMFNLGQDKTFSVKVENKGEVASQPCQGALKVNGVSAKTFPVAAIPAGGSAIVPFTWKVSGLSKITIVIDEGGANIEADKANNVWEMNI